MVLDMVIASSKRVVTDDEVTTNVSLLGEETVYIRDGEGSFVPASAHHHNTSLIQQLQTTILNSQNFKTTYP